MQKPAVSRTLTGPGALTFDYVKTLRHSDRMRFFSRVCRAIGYAHEKGVVHRDIKPSNVLLADDGSPVVADFGLCYINDGGDRPTETGEQVGSRFYMAPELADGRAENITPRADVYSLGKLAHWMFAGRPFDREKLRVGDFDLTKKEPRATHAVLYQLLERMILERPEDRLPDGNAVAQEAEALAERIAMDAHALDLTIPQACQYCQAGNYEIRVDPRWWFAHLHPRPEQYPGEFLTHAGNECRKYGLAANKGAPWLVLQCVFCGNVQIFQLFHTNEPLKNWGLKK